MYIDKWYLDDIVNKYNNTYHKLLKWSLLEINVKDNTYINFGNKKIIMILNFKLVIMQEYQNKKNTFTEGYTPNWSEGVFINKKVINIVPWT